MPGPNATGCDCEQTLRPRDGGYSVAGGLAWNGSTWSRSPIATKTFPSGIWTWCSGPSWPTTAPVRGCHGHPPVRLRSGRSCSAARRAASRRPAYKNAYFPLLIPESLLTKEAEHVEGFAPEVAWVTHAGGQEQLEERLAIRPTSETIFGTMYAKWIQSWRDLPLLINQWCSVVRWEKRTRLSCAPPSSSGRRAHTAHRRPKEAQERDDADAGGLPRLRRERPGDPGGAGAQVRGREVRRRRRDTYTHRGADAGRRALQAGTSHFLGDNFAKAFDISFLGHGRRAQLRLDRRAGA